MAGLFKKSLLHEQKMQKPLEITNFPFASRLKIQVCSFLTASIDLENWMKSLGKQRYIYTFFFLIKIATTPIWPSGVLDYSNNNDNWTITPLRHISLIPKYLFFFKSRQKICFPRFLAFLHLYWDTFLWFHGSFFFFTSINYNEEKTSHSKKKILKIQNRHD